jgi:hypothetical protein
MPNITCTTTGYADVAPPADAATAPFVFIAPTGGAPILITRAAT